MLAVVVVAAILLGGVAGFGASFLRPAGESEASVVEQNDAMQQSIESIAEDAVPKTVMIRMESESAQGFGSGFFFRADGYILTNYHVAVFVLEFEEQTTVVLSDGRQYKPRFIGGSVGYDVAVLKIDLENEDAEHFTLADSSKVKIGQSVIAVGSPLGLQSTVTTGIISAKDRPAAIQDGDDFIFYSAFQTDTAINGGNSGGPLLDMNGDVLGINSASRQSGEGAQLGLNFAIQSNQVKRLAQELIGTGDATFPYLGITLDKSYRGPGVKIAKSADSVEAGSPADDEGLAPGDVITVMNKVPLGGPVDFVALVRGYSPGDSFTLTISAGASDKGREITIKSSSQPTSKESTISSQFIV